MATEQTAMTPKGIVVFEYTTRTAMLPDGTVLHYEDDSATPMSNTPKGVFNNPFFGPFGGPI